MFIDDPQAAGNRFLVQVSDHVPEHAFDCSTALGSQAQHDQSGVVFWRERLDVGEIEIQRDQDSSFSATGLGDLVVISATETLIIDGRYIVTHVPERLADVRPQVLIELE
jgi:hypothetical protein